MLVKYCNAKCQKNHWPTHKKLCKQRAAELHDEALFKDPPAKDDCPLCCLPMPLQLIKCISLPPATVTSIPIYDLAHANKELANGATDQYFNCCGKSICGGCVQSYVNSFRESSGRIEKCPFCKSNRLGKSNEEEVEELMKRVEAKDAGSTFALGNYYRHGNLSLQPDWEKAKELWIQAAKLGSSQAQYCLGNICDEGGDSKKAKFHYEAAAMAGHDEARYNLGQMELGSGSMERAVKHWIIAASAGNYDAMQNLLVAFNKGLISRDEVELTLTAYNNSCAEMRSETRDNYIAKSYIEIQNRYA